MSRNDTYRTLEIPSPVAIFKDRGSKFLGYAFPLEQEQDVKQFITELKESHTKARHWCYAWQLGKEESAITYRANDDGEPNNSAGQPIYGQILSKELTNILVVVVRYFGGTKLGVGGLINAYKITAEMALDASDIVEKIIVEKFKLIFDYPHMNKVMRVIKEKKLTIESQKMELNCEIVVSVRRKDTNEIESIFLGLRCLQLVKV